MSSGGGTIEPEPRAAARVVGPLALVSDLLAYVSVVA